MLLKNTCIILLMLITSKITIAQTKSPLNGDKKLIALADKELKDAAEQYKYFGKNIPENLFPRSLKADGALSTSDSRWWCSGFYPGTLAYLYEATGDNELYNAALGKLKLLEKEQYNKTTHDLGFMMYCSFGNMNRLKPDPTYNPILINSAKSLSTRFSPTTGVIRSWDSKKADEFLVIIDNMMNLELLTYATKITGDSSYYKVAVTHADHTLKNHFRPDYSSFHVIEYNPLNGEVKRKRTQQGTSDASAWARGQGWGLYGYTLMYRETKDKKYLHQANQIAKFILNHPNLPTDKVPYWDFDAPGIPNVPRDASTAALVASALLELSTYVPSQQSKTYTDAATAMIRSLSSPAYKSTYKANQGFLLAHSTGNIPEKSEIDVPLTYADYYYVEALLRAKTLAQGKSLRF